MFTRDIRIVLFFLLISLSISVLVSGKCLFHKTTGKCSLLFSDFCVRFQVLCLQEQGYLLGADCSALISILSCDSFTLHMQLISHKVLLIPTLSPNISQLSPSLQVQILITQ